MALGVIAVGAVSLIGRLFDTAALVSVLSSLFPLRVNAGICFIIAGAALWLLSARNYRPRHRKGVASLALAVFAIASATAAEHMFQLDFGIDELLIKDTLGPPRSNPGRMPLVTAIHFAIFALALLAIDAPKLRALAQIAMLAIAAQRVFIVAAIVYGVTSAGGQTSFWSVSLHGSIAQICLAAGIADEGAARRDRRAGTAASLRASIKATPRQPMLSGIRRV
jgi:hypothetical protein